MKENEGIWERWMRTFIPFSIRFWWIILPVSILLTLGGLQVARSLKLDTNLERLLPEHSENVVHLKSIQKKSGGSHDLRIVLEGGTLEVKVKAAEEFSQFLKSKKDLVRSVRYTTPKYFFDKHQYELIPLDALDIIQRRAKAEREKHSDFTDPLGIETARKAEKVEVASQESDTDEGALDDAKDLLNRLESMLPYYQTKDGEFLSIRVIPAGEKLDIEANRKTLHRFEALVKEFDFKRFDPAMKTAIYGSIPDHIARYDSIASDLQFGVWGLLFILLVVIIYFRSIGSVVVLVPPLIAGLSWGLAVTAWYEKTLNSITVFLVLIIFGMGIEFGLHLFSRFIDERKKKAVFESLLLTWQATGRATITSSIALLVGYAILIASSFQGFAQFGRVAIILVTFTAVGFLGLTPAWIAFVEKIRGEKRNWPYTFTQWIMYRTQNRFLWRPASILSLRALSIVLAIAGIVCSLLFLRFDYQFDDGVARVNPPRSRDALKSIYTERLKPSAVAVFKNDQNVHEFLQYFDKRKSDYPDIELVSGLPSFLPVDQPARIQKLHGIADELELSWLKNMKDDQVRKVLREIKIKSDQNEFVEYGASEVPPELRDPFIAMDNSGDQLVYIYDIGGDTDGKKSMKFSDAVSKIKAESGLLDVVSGQEIIFADVVRRVIQEGPWLVIGMLIFVFLICWLDFRNLKSAAITISPILLGFLMTGLILIIFNTKINFYNMVALASLGSMVVDNSVHLYHRFLEFRDDGVDEPARDASRAVSPTVNLCTITSILGYFGMVFAAHKGVASLGFVAVSGLICCLVSATLLFPAWLYSKKRLESDSGKGMGA